MVSPSARTSCDAAALRCATAVLLLGLGAGVHAAHPLLTEDTGTQGSGKFELELGNAWTRDGANRAYEFGPQLSYGMLPNLDAILRPTWVAARTSTDGAATTARGAGDTAADAKWRFYDAGMFSLATRAGIGVPTGDADRGLGAGKPIYHALLVASFDAAPLALHANLGYTRGASDPMTRRDLFHVSTAALVSVGSAWQLLLYDVAFDTNPERARATAPGVVRIGAIYTVREGCNIDVGYQARLNRAAPATGLQVGLTLQW